MYIFLCAIVIVFTIVNSHLFSIVMAMIFLSPRPKVCENVYTAHCVEQ